MKRVLVPVALAVIALAGCGGDTCTSSAAQVTPSARSTCSTIAASAPVTFQVQLCPQCTDSSPSCTAEVVGQDIQIDPVVQQCQANSGCDITRGCSLGLLACPLNASLAPGTTYTVRYLTPGGPGQLDVTVAAGGSTSCTL